MLKRRVLIRSLLTATSALLSALLLFASDARANGAAAHQGIYGSEITVEEGKPSGDLTVDESVTIDFTSSKISVSYKIFNQSDKALSFEMLFPVEIFGQGSVGLKNDSSFTDYLQFHVILNGHAPQTREVPKSEVRLENGYRQLDASVAAWILFPVQLETGPNELSIDYRLLAEETLADGSGERWSTGYSIWPAKNWVSQFRTAVWRVIVPQRSDLKIAHYRYIHEFDNWYTTDDDPNKRIWSWRKGLISVDGPGERHEYPDRVEFTTSNFPPEGRIFVKVSMLQLADIVSKSECRQRGCTETYLRIHPYLGDKRCYRAEDLGTEPGYMELELSPSALPYLRNEIFARKGYQFNTPIMKEMFERMPWYQGRLNEVQLTDIEKWNVNAIAELEKYLDQSKGTVPVLDGPLWKRIPLPPCPNEPFDQPLPAKVGAPPAPKSIRHEEPQE